MNKLNMIVNGSMKERWKEKIQMDNSEWMNDRKNEWLIEIQKQKWQEEKRKYRKTEKKEQTKERQKRKNKRKKERMERTNE